MTVEERVDTVAAGVVELLTKLLAALPPDDPSFMALPRQECQIVGCHRRRPPMMWLTRPDGTLIRVCDRCGPELVSSYGYCRRPVMKWGA